MKVRSLCTMSLVALLGASLVGGAQVFAEETENPTTEKHPEKLDSEGKVVVEEGGEPGDGKTPDPEKPDEKLPDIPGIINPNPDGGALMIDQVSNLDFGKIKTSSKEINAYAKPIELPAKEGETEKRTRGAIVGWSDIRGGVYGYTITAALTKQFTAVNDSTSVLNNSQIHYLYGMTVADGENDNPIPSNIKTGFELIYSKDGTTAIDVVNAANTVGEGKGTFVLEFGQSKDYENIVGEKPKGDPGTDGKSVELIIPASTASNMNLDTYTATVTWKIVAAPGDEQE